MIALNSDISDKIKLSRRSEDWLLILVHLFSLVATTGVTDEKWLGKWHAFYKLVHNTHTSCVITPNICIHKIREWGESESPMWPWIVPCKHRHWCKHVDRHQIQSM